MARSSLRRASLALETLEDRAVPAAFGTPWPDARHLSLSFAPDGTTVDTRASTLSQTLSGQVGANWQPEILRAFQTWAVAANVNVGVVSDGGQALGSAGPLQSDPRFGDVRVVAVPFADSSMAVATPLDVLAGTRSGDLWLNAAGQFSIGGAGAPDLFTVALHEAGHSLGLDSSSNPGSVMYDQYTGVRTGLGVGDAAALQALYGPRQPDIFDLQQSNDVRSSATRIALADPDKPATSLEADLTTHADIDNYRLDVLPSDGPVIVRIRTAGLSLLMPRLDVFDDAGHVVATGIVAAGPGSDISVTLPAPTGTEARYYLQVTAATGDVFGIGSYRLQVQRVSDTPPQPSSNTLIDPEIRSNDTMGTATTLNSVYTSTNGRYNYTTLASINTATDVDFYRLRSPQGANNSAGAMTVTVWQLGVTGLDPVASVYDSRGVAVPASVLVHDNGSFTLQVPSAVANQDYYVAVRGGHPNQQTSTGNYFLGVTFSPNAVAMQTFLQDTLTAAAPQAVKTMTVNEPQLTHFVLSANGDANAALRLTLYDAAYHPLLTRFAAAGDVLSFDVFLTPGSYTLRFDAAARTGTLGALNYSLAGRGLSDPIGPQPVTGGGPPPVTIDPTGGTTFLGPVDAYGQPWWDVMPSNVVIDQPAALGNTTYQGQVFGF